MYKLPDNITPEKLREFKGLEGTVLNPVEDADGNWVVGDEEWESHEFTYLKEKYPNLAALFVQIPYKPKPPVKPY
jgi:hypothetical protein